MSRARFIAVAFLVLLLGSQAAWGAEIEDEREYKFMQGVISARAPGVLFLNETRKVNITPETRFFDSKGMKATSKDIAVNKWLYVEGVKERDGSVTAVDVYYLPGYVNKKNKSKYGFMQLP